MGVGFLMGQFMTSPDTVYPYKIFQQKFSHKRISSLSSLTERAAILS